MIGHPKPVPREKEPKRLIRKAPTKVRAKRIKYSNAYTHPEWRAKVRRIRKRSRGICEAQVRCGGNPVEGDPHHLDYNREFKGWRRLMVDDDQLIDCCRACHLWYEQQKEAA